MANKMKTPAAPDAAMFSQLAKNAIRGKQAKKKLGRKLAQLPADKLRQISPTVFAQLGPVGLAEFAAHSKTMSSLASEPTASGPGTSRIGWSFRLRKPWRFWHPYLKAAVLTMLTASIGLVFSGVARMDLPHSQNGRIGTWPICTTLDSWTDGCRYVVTESGLTLSMLAIPLDIRATRLGFNNDIGINVPLRPGSSIIVHRVDLFGDWETDRDISNF